MEVPKLAEKRTKVKRAKRYAHNLRLIILLASLVLENRTLRFNQILQVFKFVTQNSDGSLKDEFYIEPEEVLNRVYEARREIEANKKQKVSDE